MFVDIDSEFPLDAEILYLNHAAVAPWPRRAADAVKRFAEENMIQGASRYPGWLEVESALREQLQRLLNAPSSDDVALLKNTSEGLSVVAWGLDWQPGDNVVISNEEFPSNRIVWDSLRSRGVALREADLSAAPTPEDALFQLVDEGTRLLAVSSVQYASGLRMDLGRIGEFCRSRGVLFCVDAIQSLGVLPLDVQAIGADFVAADAHKWLLGPEGIAVFYCRPDLRDRLRLHQYGWHMVEHAGDFDRRDWAPARSARRFECGSPNMLGIHAFHASLALLLEVGIEEVGRRVEQRLSHLIEGLKDVTGVDIVTPESPSRRAGILTFSRAGVQADLLWRHLTDRGVVCAKRGGGVRFSPHFYTPLQHLDQAVELTAERGR